MSTIPRPEFEIPLDDEEGDRLMEKADALMQRHSGFSPAAPEADDLPVLTDVVDERIEPFIGEAAPIILESVEPEPGFITAAPNALSRPATGSDALAERLVALDTAISRHIEDWVANELPQLASRELDELAERLRAKAAAHLRATLLPLISAEIADTLDNDSDA